MARPRGSRRLPLLAARALAVLLVCALTSLLVFQLARGPGGTRIRLALAAHRSPVAPGFRLPVIWTRTTTRQPPLRRGLARGFVALRDVRGHPVVLNFFASWCDACRREAGSLAAAARAGAPRVIVIGVDVDDFAVDARRFLRKQRAPYVAVHGTASTAEAFGLVGLPETFYLDRRGRIRGLTQGQASSAQLHQGIRQASGSG